MRLRPALRTGSPRRPVTLPVVSALVAVAMLLAVGTARAQSTMWDAFRKRPSEPVVYPEILRDAAWLRAHAARPRRDRRGRAPRRRVSPRGTCRWHGTSIPPPGTDDRRWPRRFLSAAGVSSDGEVVCVSDRANPAASGALFWLLELAGHPHVTVLNGGMEAWRGAGGAIEDGEPSAPCRALRRRSRHVQDLRLRVRARALRNAWDQHPGLALGGSVGDRPHPAQPALSARDARHRGRAHSHRPRHATDLRAVGAARKGVCGSERRDRGVRRSALERRADPPVLRRPPRRDSPACASTPRGSRDGARMPTPPSFA